jgi:hypothetical protein
MKAPVVILVSVLAVFAGLKAHAQMTPITPKPVVTVPVPPSDKPTKPEAYKNLPPVEHDHQYEGDLTITIVDTLEALYTICLHSPVTKPYLLACSWRNDKSCLVVMVKDEVMRTRGYNTGLLLRHEIGHCNGWGREHEGERAIGAPNKYWVPAPQRVGYGRNTSTFKGKDQ